MYCSWKNESRGEEIDTYLCSSFDILSVSANEAGLLLVLVAGHFDEVISFYRLYFYGRRRSSASKDVR